MQNLLQSGERNWYVYLAIALINIEKISLRNCKMNHFNKHTHIGLQTSAMTDCGAILLTKEKTP